MLKNKLNDDLSLFENLISDSFVRIMLLFLLFLYTAAKLQTCDAKFEVTVFWDVTLFSLSYLYIYIYNYDQFLKSWCKTRNSK
jgi:hypothetical protein